MTPSVQAFEVSSEEEIGAVLERLEQSLDGRALPESSERRRYLDTFDWRIFRAGAWLSESVGPGQLLLSWSMGTAPPSTVPGTNSPKSAADLPDSSLRQVLGPIVSPRALRPVAEVLRRSRGVELLDVERKIVARVTATSCHFTSIPGAAPTFRLVLEGVRGYDDEYQAAYRLLRYQLSLAVPEGREIDAILNQLPEGAGMDPSALQMPLSKETGSGQAVRQVLAGLWDIIARNHEGVLSNLDTEFLHDFRVAVRRTRSVLAQIGDVLPKAALEHYANEFRWLGQATGPARDLDVLQLNLPDYRSQVADVDARALDALVSAVAARRKSVQRTLRNALTGERFNKLESTWKPFLMEAGHQGHSDDAGRPVREVAAQRTWKRYQKVRSRGLGMDGQTPVAELHALRIQCKKLRYLLDVFNDVYPAARLATCTKALKQLQTILGDLNDLQVHGTLVREFAGRMGAKPDASPQALVAAGVLVASLDSRCQNLRSRFLARFETFAGEETDASFRKLLKARKR